MLLRPSDCLTHYQSINLTSQAQCINNHSSKKSFTLKKLIILPALLMGLASLTACQTMTNSTSSATMNNSASQSSSSKVNGSDSEFAVDNMRHEYRLENGLKVIIKEDHRAPVAMTQIWYKVGATDEPEDKGGISHLLEHLMFKGTDKVSGSDFDRLIVKFGGDHNAFTSYNYTGYYEMFPVNRLSLALELEADRMSNLKFDSPEFQNEFEQEKQVVMEERRQRTDDNPMARAFEKFRLMALPDSPKGQSVIGPMHEIQSIQIDDLQKWYQTWYTPNNATLVIVGDVKPDEVMTEVKKYFGSTQSKQTPTRPSVQQKAMRGYQAQTIKESVKVPTIMMAFNVPTLPSAHTANLPDKNIYDLMMLQFVMDGGYAARFEKNLVREQGLLASIGTHYDPFERGDDLFMIQATPREGVSLQEAQDAIMTEINKLKSEPILTNELERARTTAVKDYIFSQDSMAGQASMIGRMQTNGLDDRLAASLSDKIANVTSEDINSAAKRYLVKDNLSVMYVEPATDSID